METFTNHWRRCVRNHGSPAATSRTCQDSLFDNLDDALDGRLIKSENYQALNTLKDKFKGRVKCCYIDPPYNTGSDGFVYNDTFRHSSWISMIQDRVTAAVPLLAKKGVLYASIDDKERRHLEFALDQAFGRDNRVEEIIWVQNTTKNQSPTYSTNHEYVEVYAQNLKAASADARIFREPKPGYGEVMELIEKLNPSYPSITDVEAALAELFEKHKFEFKEELEEMGVEYDRNLDLWKGLYNYGNAEYRDEAGKLVKERDAKKKNAKLWVWREGDSSMPAAKQAESTRDSAHPNFRFYKPLHPTTKRPCPHPKTGWRWPEKIAEDRDASFEQLAADNRIVWGEDEAKVPQAKKFLHETETNVAKSVVMDYTDGEKQLTELLGKSNSFPNPKPTTLISRFVLQTADADEWVMDFTGGSGTTAHAVAEAFHTDRVRRKFLLIEAADYFDTTLLPRVKRVFAATSWKKGKPVALNGAGLFCKVCSLEQYEDAVAHPAYQEETGDLFRNTKTDPYSQYVFFRDGKMARALELDYEKDEVNVQLDRLYPDIDLAETLSCVTGKWIKRVRPRRCSTSARASKTQIPTSRSTAREPIEIWR